MTNFSNFGVLDPESADLVHDLIRESSVQQSPFSSFAMFWMAFNGWMACVTEAGTDGEMILVLSNNDRLSDAFNRAFANSNEFCELVQNFAAHWPVISVHDVRKRLGRDALRRFSREELWDQVQEKRIKFQPADYAAGDLSWSKTLRAIYLVRCNLFHGSKSPNNFRDHELVVASDRVLRGFVEVSGCFAWEGDG